ncbi:hypothetical protein PISMIDRAFT_678033 [Pisolithus microcarpus 441]|uniref:Uncharacterized protein n=1 Tax=Pisolithus microcarpus 441 TaxID=765257 RepID=A0A0C9Z641_9AGAM|nr:hypothetical protein PISMIDRAFT_678033 [Pisolithus microcarpus 441]
MEARLEYPCLPHRIIEYTYRQFCKAIYNSFASTQCLRRGAVHVPNYLNSCESGY